MRHTQTLAVPLTKVWFYLPVINKAALIEQTKWIHLFQQNNTTYNGRFQKIMQNHNTRHSEFIEANQNVLKKEKKNDAKSS